MDFSLPIKHRGISEIQVYVHSEIRAASYHFDSDMSPISRSIFLTLCPYSSRNAVRPDMSPSTGTVFSVPISHMAHGASVTGTCIHELDTLWALPEPSKS